MNSDDNASIHHNDARGGLARWQLKRVKDYIEANLGSIIRAADLARIAFLGSLTGKLPQGFVDAPSLPASGFNVSQKQAPRQQQ